MDLTAIEQQIQLLRERRQFLPEIRDYKPQRKAGAKAKESTPMIDNRDAEDIFPGLFKEETTDDISTVIGTAESNRTGSNRTADAGPGPTNNNNESYK